MTNLTALKLVSCPAVGDAAIIAIASKLTGLRKLWLCRCGLQNPTLWPVIGGLTNLEELVITTHRSERDVPVFNDSSLQFLLPLKQLTRLSIGASSTSVEAAAAFRAAMPQLKFVDVDGW